MKECSKCGLTFDVETVEEIYTVFILETHNLYLCEECTLIALAELDLSYEE